MSRSDKLHNAISDPSLMKKGSETTHIWTSNWVYRNV